MTAPIAILLALGVILAAAVALHGTASGRSGTSIVNAPTAEMSPALSRRCRVACGERGSPGVTSTPLTTNLLRFRVAASSPVGLQVRRTWLFVRRGAVVKGSAIHE
jgi:hypothetical protein